MLIVAALGLGTRLVTELTIDLELRGCTVNDELMSGVATTFVRSCNFGSSSWICIILNLLCLLTPIDNEFES